MTTESADFLPWDSTSETLHINVVVDGQKYVARVSREALADHSNVPHLSTAEEARAAFVQGDLAQRIRSAAVAKIRGGDTHPTVTTADL